MKHVKNQNVIQTLTNYYRKIMHSDVKPLGRWNLIYDHRLQKRIDMANTDHCGPCGSMYPNLTLT